MVGEIRIEEKNGELIFMLKIKLQVEALTQLQVWL